MALAQQLGVTYERLGQWKRGEAALRTARRLVHERASHYLQVPVVVVLVLAGSFGARDFLWPSQGNADERLAGELEAMQQDPAVGPFMPASLFEASVEVRWFVVWFYKDLRQALGADMAHWLETLRRHTKT